MLKIKLFVVGAFLAVASSGIFLSSGKTSAQTSASETRRDEILERIGGYKNWKQVQKPPTPDNDVVGAEALRISDSSIAG